MIAPLKSPDTALASDDMNFHDIKSITRIMAGDSRAKPGKIVLKVTG